MTKSPISRTVPFLDLPVIREFADSLLVVRAQWLVVVCYPGRSDHGVTQDEERLLLWSAEAIAEEGHMAVLAVSSRYDAVRRPAARGLNSVREQTGLWVVADPPGQIGSALGLPIAQTSGGIAYEHSTLVMTCGRAAQLWHPVNPLRDAALVTGWIAQQDPLASPPSDGPAISQLSDVRGSQS